MRALLVALSILGLAGFAPAPAAASTVEDLCAALVDDLWGSRFDAEPPAGAMVQTFALRGFDAGRLHLHIDGGSAADLSLHFRSAIAAGPYFGVRDATPIGDMLYERTPNDSVSWFHGVGGGYPNNTATYNLHGERFEAPDGRPLLEEHFGPGGFAMGLGTKGGIGSSDLVYAFDAPLGCAEITLWWSSGSPTLTATVTGPESVVALTYDEWPAGASVGNPLVGSASVLLETSIEADHGIVGYFHPVNIGAASASCSSPTNPQYCAAGGRGWGLEGTDPGSWTFRIEARASSWFEDYLLFAVKMPQLGWPAP